MHVFVTDDFDDFMRLAGLSDQEIWKAALEVEAGLFEANLGGVLKKRLASRGMSKRDANRSIVAFRAGDSLFFIDGWRKCDVPKTGKEIPDRLLETYRLLGQSFLAANSEQRSIDIKRGLLREVKDE